MASAAEQMAANISLANFAKATDLKKRLWFTLGALIVFRLLSFVPLPGIDPRALNTLFDTTRGGVLDFFNMFSGGSLERMSLIALGVMPYITASIVVQLATSMSPTLAALKKEGESGRKKINQYTRYGTVLLCAIQGYFIAVGLEGWGQDATGSAVIDPGMVFRFTTVISLVGGTMFLMWLGEQITSRGIGNGVSLIIMAGIVAQLPTALAQAFEGGRTGSLDAARDHRRDASGARPDPVHLLHGARPAPGADPISQAPDRARPDAGRALASAAEAQHRRRHPADLRLVAAADAADHRPVRRQPHDRHRGHLERDVADGHDRAPARRAALHAALCGRDHLLLLLLHRGRLQSRRRPPTI